MMARANSHGPTVASACPNSVMSKRTMPYVPSLASSDASTIEPATGASA